MNVIRTLITVFVLALLIVSIAGWFWAADQPSPQSEGARVALGLCGLASIVCIYVLWTARTSFPEEDVEATQDE